MAPDSSIAATVISAAGVLALFAAIIAVCCWRDIAAACRQFVADLYGRGVVR